MPTCHACHRDLDERSIAVGRCEKCGAIVRRISQRTIDDSRFAQNDKTPAKNKDAGDELAAEESRDIQITDTDSPIVTIEISGDDSKLGSSDLKQTMASDDAFDEKASGAGRKSPTIEDRSNVTMEFQSPSETDLPGLAEKESKGHSTHNVEHDLTIDISPADSEQLDSQWRGTFDMAARQGQTIRQKDTVAGQRSSLHVKSRYIREKRKAGSMPPKSPAEVPDYELLDIIGEGGMGVVYAAHQSSIARTVAVKMLKPSAKAREDQRDKFISEAVVTGELDHPNIVPIYDLGSNEEGALFYSMKRVKGTPWDKVIHKKQLDENLSILLRVADAVAFAHAGGVIHRDLKPENVMLGDYGEVLVMDWGLARITPEFAHADSVYQPDSLGGTPAYMAPEMARGPVEKINKTSDIYLLGAILYEIIGGQPPHSGRDVMQCLMAASQNRIDQIRYEGELKDIAFRAMATQQEDRYATVKDFQAAIRVYQSHSESLVLTAHSNQNLQKALAAGDYQLFARALYGFQESLSLWDANHRARLLLAETQREYATKALENGDLDLAESLLDNNNPDHKLLSTQITTARAERDARQRRLRLAKMAVAALIAGIIATVTVAYFQVSAARDVAVVARDEAVEAKQLEEVARKDAEKKREEALFAQQQEAVARLAEEKARKEEEQARKEEEQARRAAELAQENERKAKEAEEYEAYVAEIGLAAAKINDNAYDFAKQLLNQSDRTLRNWEWGRLAHLSELGAANYPAEGRVEAVAYAPDGTSFASGDLTGQVTVRDAQTGAIRYQVPHAPFVLSVAYSPDSSKIASGGENAIQIIDAADGRVLSTLQGHANGVLSVQFSPDGKQLLSGSYDNTARLWDIDSGQPLQTLAGHSWWVWSAEFSPDANRIVTASQDGKAIVWQKSAVDAQPSSVSQSPRPPAANPQPTYSKLTEFTGHDGAVYSARFSPTENLVATGGYDNVVMLWNPDEVKPIDVEARLVGQPDPKSNHVRLAGHDKPVRSVAFSPKGQLVISGSEDNTIRVWDTASGESLKALRGHGSAVRSCVFSPNGQQVLSGGEDLSVRIWDLQGYQESRVLHSTVFSGHDDAVLSARFSRDGRQIATASRDRTASLWDAATGQRLQQFAEGHEFLVSGAVFFADGQRLATGAGDNSVRIWNLAAGTQLNSMSPTGRAGALAVSPDGNLIATGSPGTDAKLWNVETGQLVATLSGHVEEVRSLAFSPSGDRLASGDALGQVRVWQARGRGQPGSPDGEWALERELDGHNGSITAIRFTPNGERLVVASGDNSCGQWDIASGQELRQLVLKHPDWVSSLDLSADGSHALTSCEDGAARLWRLADAAIVATVQSPGKPFTSIGYSPDGSTAVLTSAEDKLVSLWDLSAESSGFRDQSSVAGSPNGDPQTTNPHLRQFLDFNQRGGEVWSAFFAPDGRRMLTIGGNDAQLWNIDTKSPAMHYSPHGAVASAALSPDGRLMATGSWDHSAKIWDAATGRAIRKLEGGHTGYVNSVEFSPDGRELLTASDDGTARLWNVETGLPTEIVFRGHTARITAATFSPDGTRVLTASGDATARIWDRATGKHLRTLRGHQYAVLCGQFSPDGMRVITGGRDATAKIWDIADDGDPTTLAGHSAAITAVAFSPDGTRALTGSQDNAAKLWDAQTAKEILSLPGHTQEITSVGFSPDGLNVLTASRDGTAIIWLAKDWRIGEISDLGLRIAD